MFGFFRKKVAQKDDTKYVADTKFVHNIREYGKGPSEFIVFSSVDDEEVQKKENVWVSWQAIQSILDNSANLAEYAYSLEKTLNKYADERAEKIFGGLK